MPYDDLIWSSYVARDSITWLCSCDKSSYIMSVYSPFHVVLLKSIEPNVHNQTLTQVSHCYVHVSACLKVIRPWLNLPTGGHGHVICMGVLDVWHSGCGNGLPQSSNSMRFISYGMHNIQSCWRLQCLTFCPIKQNVLMSCCMVILRSFGWWKDYLKLPSFFINNPQITQMITVYTNWSLCITFTMIYYIRQE